MISLDFEVGKALKKLVFLAGLILLFAAASFALNQILASISVGGKAALQVTADPEATIFLDGNHLGKTPFFSKELPAKEAEIKLVSPNGEWVAKTELEKGVLTVVNRELKKNILSQAGEILSLKKGEGLTVITKPSQTKVFVDGEEKGTSPVLLQITDGDHRVSVSKDGFLERAVKIKVQPDFMLIANIQLAQKLAEEKPKEVKIRVAQTPTGFLRVREGPDLASKEIGRVGIGEEFTVLQESEGFIKIRLKTGQEGWVSAQFTTKIE